MKKIIASILAAGAASLAIAGTAHADERFAPEQQQVQKADYEGYGYGYGYGPREFRAHERWERMQARRRFLEHLRHERMERLRERGYGYGRW